MRDDILPQVGQFSAAQYGSTPVIPEGDWKLPAGHFEVSPYPMEIISPRPDGTRTPQSRYSWAYPGIEYRVPICVLFGSYPFLYEITAFGGTASTATATMLGQRAYGVGKEWYESEDWRQYGILRWTPTEEDVGKTFSFTVRVTGQADEQQTITWTGVVTREQFVFVDSEAAEGGDGTFESPLNDINDLWGTSDTQYKGKIAYLRGRDTTYYQSTTNNWNTGPVSYLGYPGDPMPKVDISVRWIELTNQPDIFLQGVWFDKTAYTVQGNAHQFYFGGFTHRLVIWECRHSGGRVGSVHDNNVSYFFFDANTRPDYRHDLCWKNNIFEDSINEVGASQDFRVISSYWCERLLFEGNIVKDWKSLRMYLIKGPHNDVCIRAENQWDPAMLHNAQSYGMSHVWLVCGYDGAGDNPEAETKRIEVCWSWTTQIRIGDGAMYGYYDSVHGPVHVYRCITTSGGVNPGSSVTATPSVKSLGDPAGYTERKDVHHFRRNVFNTTRGYLHAEAFTITPGGPPAATPTTDEEARVAWPYSTFVDNVCFPTDYGNVIDDDGNLKPAYAYLRGTHGPGIAR